MSEPVLDIKNLTFGYGATPILQGVTLAVESGEYLSVIGPNGAGKTTLLKCLNRILKGWQGQVRLQGRDLTDFPQTELARHVAYVPQAEGRYYDFTVSEFVLMGRYPHLSPFSSIGPADEAAAREALRMTGTEAFADRVHATLSGGERQKVFIAAALAQSAQILLLDEATAFLDPHHEADILAILRRINREAGVTVVSVTHDINTAAAHSDRVVGLKAGRTAFRGKPAELMNNDVLGQLYDKVFTFVRHPDSGAAMVVPEVPE